MPLPPRRWFQFKLSTWFVLVAILAWAMLEWPWVRQVNSGIVYISVKPIYEVNRRINPALSYPALTLAAFVGWKAAWAIGRQVRARKAERAESLEG